MKINGIEIPSCFICPITQRIMRDPVLLIDGITYERNAIESWLQNNSSNIFGVPLNGNVFKPMESLKATIDSFLKREQLEKFVTSLDKDELEYRFLEIRRSLIEGAMRKKREELERNSQKRKAVGHQQSLEPKNGENSDNKDVEESVSKKLRKDQGQEGLQRHPVGMDIDDDQKKREERADLNKNQPSPTQIHKQQNAANKPNAPTEPTRPIEPVEVEAAREDVVMGSDEEEQSRPPAKISNAEADLKKKAENDRGRGEERKIGRETIIIDDFIEPSIPETVFLKERSRRSLKPATHRRPLRSFTNHNSFDSSLPSEERKSVIEKSTHEQRISFKTKGGGDCAFHATLGQLVGDQFVCNDVESKRKKVAEAVRGAVKGRIIFSIIVEAIEAIIMGRDIDLSSSPLLSKLCEDYQNFYKQNDKSSDESWRQFERQLKHNQYIMNFIEEKSKKGLPSLKEKFHDCLNIEEGVLYGLIMSIDSLNTLFNKYKTVTNQNFKLETKVTKEILNEYATLIEKPGQWMLPTELNIIARVFNLHIMFYSRDLTKNNTIFAEVMHFNENEEEKVAVLFNGRDHYERMNNRLLNRAQGEGEYRHSPEVSPLVVPSPLMPKVSPQKPEKKLKSLSGKLKEFIQEAEDTNDESVRFNLALAYYHGGEESCAYLRNKNDQKVLREVVQDFKQAYHWFSKVIEIYKDDPDSLNYLGQMEFLGQGTGKNEKEGLKKLELAISVEKPSSDAQYFLGFLYRQGTEPVKRNEARAFELFWAAANNGHSGAQFNLGELFDFGIGVARDEKQAFLCYEKAAQQGYVYALDRLGELYYEGLGIAEDRKKAQECFEKAGKEYEKMAAQGDVLALNRLGEMQLYGLGRAVDGNKALGYFVPAAKQGNIEAKMNIATMNALGLLIPKNLEYAFEWYKSAADQGCAEAQYYVGNCYAQGVGIGSSFALGGPRETDACIYYEKASKQGHSEATNSLGEMYKLGRVLGYRDLKKAFELFKEAAPHSAVAQFNLGEMLEHGNEACLKNEVEAFNCYQKSAEEGYDEGQYALGRMYLKGVGTQKDESKAFEWYLKAAKQGNGDALYIMGQAYYSGNLNGIQRNYEQAVQYWMKAAEMGHPRSRWAMGYMCEKGYGVPKDINSAVRWWEAAAALGENNAKIALDNLKKRQTQSQAPRPAVPLPAAPMSLVPAYDVLSKISRLEKELEGLRRQLPPGQAFGNQRK